MSQTNNEIEDKGQIQTLNKPSSKTQRPPLYKVLILNDDYTPMDFVIHVLKKFFKKGETEAAEIMLHVHNRGSGLAGIYTYEIAETKVFQTNEYSRKNQHPLKCTLEKVSINEEGQ
ncbi:MAG: ATP-dependent Clp protease adapter ClpS [Bdellovibrionaceae bacterium]|nr:ATP-dependent Clp protease adapter ClpS [Pseudobdellovibrionaceae bacterium]